MPGMGLTAIGLAGVTVSYSGIAHTFIDGMHALTGLTLFIGMIFLAAGILEGGVSTSNRAKATTLVVLSIALSFGAFAFTMNTISTMPMFAGILIIIAFPSVVIAYMAMKMPTYVKPVGVIFALAAGAGIVAFVSFGLVGPSPYLIGPEPVEEAATPALEEIGAPVFAISILVDSSIEGNPDYEPDVANVPQGNIIEWTNLDAVAHTVTSSADVGETFDSSLMGAGEKFRLDTNTLAVGEYEYFCIVHPWMVATIIIEEAVEPTKTEVSIPEGAGIEKPGQLYYDPNLITVTPDTMVVWKNVDTAIHTVTSVDGSVDSFDSDIISGGQNYERIFSTIGTHDYFCIVHPWMKGTVIVE